MELAQAGNLRYKVFGPFPFRASGEIAHRQTLKEFWADRKHDSPVGLKDAVGIYVWTVKDGKRRIPCNVGLTDRQGFGVRFGQKETMFLRRLGQDPAPEWEVYLLPLLSKTGRFRKATNSQALRANDWLETMLIASAIKVNADLINKAKVKYLKHAVVEGYLNDNEEDRSEAAKSFSTLFKVPAGKRK